MPLFGGGRNRARCLRRKHDINAVLREIMLKLRWNVIGDGQRWSEEGLLTAHMTADFLDDFRRSLGPVFDQTSNKERGNGRQQRQGADHYEFHAHRPGSDLN